MALQDTDKDDTPSKTRDNFFPSRAPSAPFIDRTFLTGLNVTQADPIQETTDGHTNDPDGHAFGSTLREMGEDFRERNSLNSLVKKGDRQGLLQYFLPEIVGLAQMLDPNREMDRDDLLAEGVAAALEFLHTSTPRNASIRTSITQAAENGMQRVLLTKTLRELRETVDTDVVASIGYDYPRYIDSQDVLQKAKEYVADWLKRTPLREREIVRSRYDLAGEGILTFEELGEKFFVSGEYIRQLAKKTIHKLPDQYARKLKGLFEQLDSFVDESSRHDRQIAEVERYSDILASLERELGAELDHFMRRRGLSPSGATDFLAALYPKLDSRARLRLVSMSEKEREQVEADHDFFGLRQAGTIESLQKSIKILEEKKQTIGRAEKISLFEQVQELYFHLFVTDRDECLRQLGELERKLQQGSSDLSRIFAQARDYFAGVEKLEVPGLKAKLDPYQKIDVEIATRQNSFLIASEMGTGKSVEALAFALRKEASKVLIVSTKSAIHSTWPKEIHKHIGRSEKVVTLSSKLLADKDSSDVLAENKWHLVTYSSAARAANIKKLRNLGYDLVILDECHKINHQSSAQSQALLSLEPRYKLAMSGSPFKNRLAELYPVLNWLFPHTFSTERDFVRSYCGSDKGLFRLQQELRTRMVYRSQSDVLKLPHIENKYEQVALNSRQRKAYEKIEQNFVSWLEDKGYATERGVRWASVVLHKLHEMRRCALEPKFSLAKELAELAVKRGEKVVLYTTYLGAAQRLADSLAKYQPFRIEGGTENTARAQMLEEFAESKKRKVFIITAAGGESIDLTAANTIVFLNKPLTFADQDQVLKRLVRRGQTNLVTAHHLVTSNTVDERIELLIQRKGEEFQRLVHTSPHLAQWFRDSEVDNVRELLNCFRRMPTDQGNGSSS
jgi:SNF2 family DNA or RNA helicase